MAESENGFHQALDMFVHGKVKVVGDLTQFDAARLRHLVQKHVTLTGSGLGQRMLDTWAETLPRFRKVIPREYRAAMQRLNASDSAELQPADASLARYHSRSDRGPLATARGRAD